MKTTLFVAALLVCSPAAALDCAKLADGHSPLSGSLTVKNEKTGATERYGLSIERGARTIVRMHNSVAGTPDILNEFDRNVLVSTSTASAAPAMKYEVQSGDGDMRSLTPGAAATYRKTITLGGKPYGVETTTQTIGAHEMRSVFGCEVEIVKIHRESETKTQNQYVPGYRIVADEDYAPALGFNVHFLTDFRSPTVALRTESAIETLNAD